MRPLNRRPSNADFVLASEYEREAPARFNLPEAAVLYLSLDLNKAHVWLASDGFYLHSENNAHIYELDEVTILQNELVLPNLRLQLNSEQSRELHSALERCVQVYGQSDGDDLELAEAADYETGDADDLGDPALIYNFGEGSSSIEGSASATKRRRSE